jgi:putative PIG3 family NAD(P)H quinone oxidoreductase
VKAIRVEERGSLRWEEVVEPQPGERDVVLRIRATAVNRADLLQRRGLYPPPPGAPEWLGLEASGIVESAGLSARLQGWKEGDAACCLLAGGGYAERVAVDARLLLPIPRGLSLLEAASLPEAFATAYLNLFWEARLQAGETVLIHAGASGVGTAAVQLARMRGARVLTTVGTEEKARRIRELGADETIVHRVEDVTAKLRSLAADQGIDVVLDCLGGEDLAAHLPLLRAGGRWVLIGLLRGPTAGLDLRPLLSRRLRLIGSTLRARPVEEKARILAGLARDVWPRLESGELRPVVHAVLPITRVEEAHDLVSRNENFGKVVLEVDPSAGAAAVSPARPC